MKETVVNLPASVRAAVVESGDGAQRGFWPRLDPLWIGTIPISSRRFSSSRFVCPPGRSAAATLDRGDVSSNARSRSARTGSVQCQPPEDLLRGVLAKGGRRRPDVSSRHDSCGKNRDDEAYEGVRVRLEARLGNMRVPLRGWVTTAHCCPPSTTVSSPLTVSAIAISAPSSFPRLPTTKSRSAGTPPGSAANSACSGLTPSSPKSAAPTAISLPPPVARPLWLSLALCDPRFAQLTPVTVQLTAVAV